MHRPESRDEVLALLRGTTTVAEVAARHRVSEAEVEAWRSLYLDGLEAGSRAGFGAPRWRRVLMSAAVLLAAGVGLVGRDALSQVGCAAPSFFTNYSLKYFCSDAPAIAADVNTNTQALATFMQNKVGTLTNNTVIATGVTVNGNLQSNYFFPAYSPWVAPTTNGGAGIVNDNVGYKALMVVGNSSAGGQRKVNLYDDVRVEGTLSVGNLRCRNTTTACSDDGTGNMVFLDRQTVACGGNEFLQSFHLQRCNPTQIQFAISCCQIGL